MPSAYQINHAPEMKDSLFAELLSQRQFTKRLVLGAEVISRLQGDLREVNVIIFTQGSGQIIWPSTLKPERPLPQRYNAIMPTKTEFADARFKVAEFSGGVPYINTLENGPKSNTILNDTTSFLMTLKKGTTMEDAERLVEQLNQFVEQISIQQLR